jgi:integrase
MNNINTKSANGSLCKSRCKLIDLDPSAYGTHTRRRTKATLVYRRTKNLRAVQLWLGHTKLESTVRYYGEPPVMLKNFPR